MQPALFLIYLFLKMPLNMWDFHLRFICELNFIFCSLKTNFFDQYRYHVIKNVL